MTKKIFRSIFLVAGTVLVASVILIMGCLYSYFGGVEEGQLKDVLDLAATAVEDGGEEYLTQADSGRYRITWVSEDGKVIYDTKGGAEEMENHADRQEIQEALNSGEGESVRYSTTLLEKTMYYAKAMPDGTVLRISVSRATVGVLAFGMMQPILIVLFLALILSGVLASRLAKRIVDPLNNLDLENPLGNNSYEEISPLLNRIYRQHREISLQLRMLRQKNDEFAQITGNMNEGLVLLDEKGQILSINPAAQKLFQANPACVGLDFLAIERSRDMSLAVGSAMEEGHSEVRMERNGREYQIDVSRIASEGTVVGAVLLTFDVTEQEFAERNRREFTANVSHELKTPLQGIMGSAELIENGLVKPEDLSRFVGHIRKEAARLVSLIEDIIRLSQLDEGGELPYEDVDLMQVVEETAENLHDAANAKKVKIAVSGETAVVCGVRRLLYEILYNLCDNAIKYNVEGGSVQINVAVQDQEAVVTVADTGIGIAPEHQSRIFERFYRVDKSHSKASGGTGLGLSIVKHAVQYHHGKIEIQSEPNQGTQIYVTLPLKK